MIAYLGTSAALRVLTISPIPGAARLTELTRQYLDQLVAQGDSILSSALLRTEILCQANRQPEIDVAEAEGLIALINLVQLEPSDLDDAPHTPGRLRTLDAIHLTVALRVGAGLVVAYDEELRRAARAIGLRVGPDTAE